jgi:hypothetical protein
MKTKIYRTLTLPHVLHGCEIWYLTLKDIIKLRVLEKRVLRRINERKVNGEDCITKILKFGNPKNFEKGVAWNARWGRGGRKFYTAICWRNLKDREIT